MKAYQDHPIANIFPLLEPDKLAKCADRKQALQMLEEIYNFRAKVKLPLVHLAKEAMNSRNRAVTYNTRVGA